MSFLTQILTGHKMPWLNGKSAHFHASGLGSKPAKPEFLPLSSVVLAETKMEPFTIDWLDLVPTYMGIKISPRHDI